jgi:hypothetical protein
MPGDQRTVRELAHRLWEARGRPDGSPERDWLDAEHQLSTSAPAVPAGSAAAPAGSAKSVDDTLKDTFPASDPPASHLPDEPPVNAGEKWAAADAARKIPTLPASSAAARRRRSPSR